jgi:hypothetical protein
VPASSTLATINGATNAVQIASSSLMSSTFVGQGAGRFPTANSCVSDILAIAQGDSSAPFPKVRKSTARAHACCEEATRRRAPQGGVCVASAPRACHWN